MVRIEFASSIQRYAPIEPMECESHSLRTVLSRAFERQPKLRSYVLDDQGAVRRHIAIFVNNRAIDDRDRQSDELHDGDTVFVMQALSGG